MRFVTILIFGLLAGCFALLFELAIMTSSFPSIASTINFDTLFSFQAFTTLLIIASIEEIAKYIFLLRYTKYVPQKNNSSVFSLILLAFFFGLGFFSLELALSLQSSPSFSLFATSRTLLLHISTSFLFIYFVFSPSDAEAGALSQTNRFLSQKSFWLVSGAVLLHLIYNIIVLLTT